MELRNPTVAVSFFEDYNKIREQFIGEKGAECADYADEVSTRLDNLGVAREM